MGRGGTVRLQGGEPTPEIRGYGARLPLVRALNNPVHVGQRLAAVAQSVGAQGLGEQCLFAVALARIFRQPLMWAIGTHVMLKALNQGRSRKAMKLAAHHGLRGADVVCAAVAIEAGAILVPLDGERLTRFMPVPTVLTLAAAPVSVAAQPDGQDPA